MASLNYSEQNYAFTNKYEATLRDVVVFCQLLNKLPVIHPVDIIIVSTPSRAILHCHPVAATVQDVKSGKFHCR